MRIWGKGMLNIIDDFGNLLTSVYRQYPSETPVLKWFMYLGNLSRAIRVALINDVVLRHCDAQSGTSGSSIAIRARRGVASPSGKCAFS